MPSVRLTVLPFPSVATKVAARDALMFWATLPSAKSHETLFQPVAPAARYCGDSTLRGEVASCIAVAPFGQRRPSLTGLSGSPSICRSCTLPSLFWLVYATREQPTVQYGQTEWDSVAPAILRFCLTLVDSATATSKPSPAATRAPAPAIPALSTSRRVTVGNAANSPDPHPAERLDASSGPNSCQVVNRLTSRGRSGHRVLGSEADRRRGRPRAQSHRSPPPPRMR